MKFEPDKYLDKEHPDPNIEQASWWITEFMIKDITRIMFACHFSVDDYDREVRRKIMAIVRREIEGYEWKKHRRRWWRLASAWVARRYRNWRSRMWRSR